MSDEKDKIKKPLPLFVNMAIAGLAGVGSAVFVHPMEMLKYRMQLSGEKGSKVDHKNSFEAVKNIAKQEKLSGFYKGISANFTRQIVFTSTRIGLYNTLVDELKKREQATVMNTTIAGMSSGAIAAVIATPTDIAIIRMTADGRLPEDQKRNYKHVFDALWRIKKEEGLSGLWRGTVPSVARAMTANVTQLMSYDTAKKYFTETFDLKDGLLLHTYSSLVSGVLYSFFSNPMDVFKTRIQQQKVVNGKPEYSGMVDVARTLVKTEGVTALWKGFPFYYLRVAPATVLLFIFMEQLKKVYNKYASNNDNKEN